MNIREGLPELPIRMQSLPLDHRGYPVPWFVQFIEGKPDFRVADGRKFRRCVKEKRCWVCGDTLGKHLAFVSGPMCGVNRTSAEPPAHLECAIFSATACPFLVLPAAKRRDSNLPNGTSYPGGIMLTRNPGVAMVWVTKSYQIMNAGNGAIVRMGAPEKVMWFAQGREATRAEVMESIRTGIPALAKIAAEEGLHAKQALTKALIDFNCWIPKEETT